MKRLTGCQRGGFAHLFKKDNCIDEAAYHTTPSHAATVVCMGEWAAAGLGSRAGPDHLINNHHARSEHAWRGYERFNVGRGVLGTPSDDARGRSRAL